MLEYLHLENVGPSPEMKLELACRLNVITGDNGLGKTLLLDAAWYALTRTWPFSWPGKGVIPTSERASISWKERNKSSVTSVFDFSQSRWNTQQATAPDTIVVYARVDGGFSVADPYRKGQSYRLPFDQSAIGTSSFSNSAPRKSGMGSISTEMGPLLAFVREFYGKRRGRKRRADAANHVWRYTNCACASLYSPHSRTCVHPYLDLART